MTEENIRRGNIEHERDDKNITRANNLGRYFWREIF
jgi:hypothetical protein